MCAYIKTDVSKPGDNKGSGADKKDKVILVDCDDIATFPGRDASGIYIYSNIVMNAGAYMVKLYGTQTTIKASADVEGDPDGKGVIQTVEIEHPGDAAAIREFRNYWMNKNIILLVERCSTSDKNLYGSICSPLQMVFKAEDDKDKNKSTFTFKSIVKGPDVGIYTGTLTLTAPVGTVNANATTIDLTPGPGRYQLTSGTVSSVAITTCTNAVDGMVFTLLGSGGSWPSTLSTDFMLASGTAWSAISGATITFKAFKTAVSSWKFYELSRS